MGPHYPFKRLMSRDGREGSLDGGADVPVERADQGRPPDGRWQQTADARNVGCTHLRPYPEGVTPMDRLLDLLLPWWMR
jgi:hypothetical protein